MCRVLSFQAVPSVCVGFCLSRLFLLFVKGSVYPGCSYCLCRVLSFQVVPIVCVGFCLSSLVLLFV